MPQWLKQYIVNTSETHIGDLINELQTDGYRVHTCDDKPLLIFKDKIVKVFIDQVWIDIIPLVKLYYNRKKSQTNYSNSLKRIGLILMSLINNF